jgi:hypothetical protein
MINSPSIFNPQRSCHTILLHHPTSNVNIKDLTPLFLYFYNMQENVYVIIDTNIWYETLLLNSVPGAAFLYALNQNNFILVVPEVISLEINKHAMKIGSEAISKIHEGYNTLQRLMGKRDDYRVPTLEELKKRGEDRLSELKKLIMSTEFTLEQARSALLRVIDESPPNRPGNQQFKDSAVWESILEIAQKGEVHFITKDSGFFQNGEPENGLSKNLAEECDKLKNSIYIYPDLKDYLTKVWKELPRVDSKKIGNLINSSIFEEIRKKGADQDYQLGDLDKIEISPFFTQDPEVLAIEFRFSYSAKLHESEVHKALVIGSCAFHLGSEAIHDVRIDEISLIDPEGYKVRGYAMAWGGITFGRKIIPHKIKHGISDEWISEPNEYKLKKKKIKKQKGTSEK